MASGGSFPASAALLAHAQALLAELLRFERPADQSVSSYFRRHPNLGRRDRGFLAEVVYAVLRRRRTLESAAGSAAPRELLLAALLKIFGLSGRALDALLTDSEEALVRKIRGFRADAASPAVRAEMPDWLWERLTSAHGEERAMQIAQGLLDAAPLDLRVNLARLRREEALSQLAARGIVGTPTPYSPAGIRVPGRPQIQRDPLFEQGLIEVQDEGSQLLAYLLAARRGEMVGDFCAGAGGKALALAMLMRGTGRVYAIDVSTKRLAALGPRAARAAVSNIHTLSVSTENDVRVKRLAGKLDRVLVDAPCSGFGTLRRNPDLKWRYGPERIEALAEQQFRILDAASRLVRSGGRLVYATCSLLTEENEAVAARFAATHPGFSPMDCGQLLAEQRIPLAIGEQVRLWPHEHGTDAFFAAAFMRSD